MPFAAKNQPDSNQWFHRDIDAMCHQLNTDPVFVDADRSITFTENLNYVNYLNYLITFTEFT